MPGDPQDPAGLPQALGRLRVALDDAFGRAGRSLDLTPQQAELLCAAMSPAPIKDLAERLRCDRSNVTRLVDRASAHGHAVRRAEAEDGRMVVVELTEAGELLARRFLAELDAQTEQLRSVWPAQRRQMVVGALAEIVDALEAGKQSRSRRRRSPQAAGQGSPGRTSSKIRPGPARSK